MEHVFIVTLWSGGKAGKRWKTLERPEPLSTGAGVRFVDADTKLSVDIIGSISVEEYEQGMDIPNDGWEPRPINDRGEMVLRDEPTEKRAPKKTDDGGPSFRIID